MILRRDLSSSHVEHRLESVLDVSLLPKEIEIRELPGSGKALYRSAVGFVTLFVFYVTVAYDPYLFALLIALLILLVALTVLGALIAVRSRWIAFSIVFGFALLVPVPYYLRTYGLLKAFGFR